MPLLGRILLELYTKPDLVVLAESSCVNMFSEFGDFPWRFFIRDMSSKSFENAKLGFICNVKRSFRSNVLRLLIDCVDVLPYLMSLHRALIPLC